MSPPPIGERTILLSDMIDEPAGALAEPPPVPRDPPITITLGEGGAAASGGPDLPFRRGVSLMAYPSLVGRKQPLSVRFTGTVTLGDPEFGGAFEGPVLPFEKAPSPPPAPPSPPAPEPVIAKPPDKAPEPAKVAEPRKWAHAPSPPVAPLPRKAPPPLGPPPPSPALKSLIYGRFRGGS